MAAEEPTPSPQSDAATADGPRSLHRAWWPCTVAAIGLLLTAYRYLDQVAGGRDGHLLRTLVNEMTAAFGAGALFFGIRALVRWRPLDQGRWLAAVPWYAAALVVFSAVHTTSNWGLRSAIYPLVGLGTYRYGTMPLRYLMEFPIDLIVVTIMVAVLHGIRQVERSRARALRTAQLGRSLTAARLEALELKLRPHFLFNALNTISSTMYRDVRAADRMIEHLADLLRASLGPAGSGDVTVEEELEGLAPYLALMAARFEERLAVGVEVGDEARAALLPRSVLQPLIENAVRHGGAERTGRGRIEVRLARDGERLAVEVADDGPGVEDGVDPLAAGLGLSATAERLRLLFGERQSMTAGNDPAGGFRVRIFVPFRTRDGEPCAS